MEPGPDFIGVGVPRCGTTWLAARLAEHPQIQLDKKQIGFFTRFFHKGYDWYHEHFRDRGDRKAGEFTPNYCMTPLPDAVRLDRYPHWSPQAWWKHLTRPYPSARDEIRKMYPGVKVMMVFRNPVDRAWSYYWWSVGRRRSRGKEHLIVPFEKMFRDDGRWIRTTGQYGTLLRYWREAFPGIGVFLHDDMVADPRAFVGSVCRFLGVDDTFEANLEKRENAQQYEAMSAETRKMLQDSYRAEIEDFFKQIGRELTWLD